MACNSSNSKRLEQALLFAGDNRGELEKVLTHYKNNPEKLEAARFLICNMPRWYGYEGWQLDIKPVLIQKNKGEIVPKEVIEKWRRVSFYSLPKVYDAKVITADYLIENIDLAFDVWKRYPWNQKFGIWWFLRINPPISYWRWTVVVVEKVVSWPLHSDLDSAYRGNDVIEACKAVDKELKRVHYRWDTDLNIPGQRADFLFYYRVGFCREACDVTLYAMRACDSGCLRTFCLFTRISTSTLLDYFTGYNRKIYSVRVQWVWGIPNQPRKRRTKRGKVYRYCFGVQEEPFSGITKDEKVPALFRNRFIKDVTANYYGENKVSIPVQSQALRNMFIWVFSVRVDGLRYGIWRTAIKEMQLSGIWNLISSINHWSRTGTTTGRQVIRLFICGKEYPYWNQIPSIWKKPLSNGKCHYVVDTRIFHIAGIIGSRIEASLNRDFSNADLLYQFNDTLRTNYCELTPPDKNKKYRYIRFLSPPDNILELAEFTVFENSTHGESIKLNGSRRLSVGRPAS